MTLIEGETLKGAVFYILIFENRKEGQKESI